MFKWRSKQERAFVKYVRDRVTEGLSKCFDLYDIPNNKIPVYKVEDIEHVKRVMMKFDFFHRRTTFLNYLFARSYTVLRFFSIKQELYIAWLCTPIVDSDRRSVFLPNKNTFDPKTDRVSYNMYEIEDLEKSPIGICYFKIPLGEMTEETIMTIENLFTKMEKERTVKIDVLDLLDENAAKIRNPESFDDVDIETNPIMV